MFDRIDGLMEQLHPMKKNRKKSDSYRLNGNPFLHARSNYPVTMVDLKLQVKQFQAARETRPLPTR